MPFCSLRCSWSPKWLSTLSKVPRERWRAIFEIEFSHFLFQCTSTICVNVPTCLCDFRAYSIDYGPTNRWTAVVSGTRYSLHRHDRLIDLRSGKHEREGGGRREEGGKRALPPHLHPSTCQWNRLRTRLTRHPTDPQRDTRCESVEVRRADVRRTLRCAAP